MPKRSPAELVGKFRAVLFSPEHLSLIKSGPALRRNFIDAALCQVKPAYAPLLSRYNHTLVQRNALLKDIPRHAELLAVSYTHLDVYKRQPQNRPPSVWYPNDSLIRRLYSD